MTREQELAIIKAAKEFVVECSDFKANCVAYKKLADSVRAAEQRFSVHGTHVDANGAWFCTCDTCGGAVKVAHLLNADDAKKA